MSHYRTSSRADPQPANHPSLFCRYVTSPVQVMRYSLYKGGHDNGYTTTLNYLQTDGLLDKVTLLRGHEILGNELRSLKLPEVKLDGLFMTDKLQSQKSRSKSTASNISPADFEAFKTHSQPPTSKANPATPKPLIVPIQVSFFFNRLDLTHNQSSASGQTQVIV